MAMETLTAEQYLAALGGAPPLKLPTRKVTKQDRASLEDSFIAAWRCVAKDLPEPTRQYRFFERRRWRFDFCWPDAKLAVEIQGGSFIKGGGGHSRGAGQAKDHEKINQAQLMGYTVLQFATKAMGDPYRIAAEVAEVLRERIGRTHG